MNNRIIKYSNMVFHDTYVFLVIVTIALSFLTYQPFSPLVRAGVYGLFMVFSGLFFLVNVRNRPPVINFLSCIGIAFYVISTISYCYKGDIWTEGFPHFQYVFLALVALSPRSDNEVRREILAMSKITVAASLILTVLSFLGRPFVYLFPNYNEFLPKELARMVYDAAVHYGDRLGGFGSYPNLTACYVTTGVMLSIYLISLRTIGIKWKIACWMNIVLSTILTIFFCASRTNTLTLLGFFVLYPFCYVLAFYRKDKKAMKYFFITLIALIFIFIIAVLVMLSIPDIRNYIFNTVMRVDNLATGSGRTTIWKYMLNEAKGHWIFGVSKSLIRDRFAGAGSMHNMFLELFVILGVPAMLTYLIYFFGTMFLTGRAVYKESMDYEQRLAYLLIFTVLVITVLQGMFENFLFSKYCNPATFVTFFLASGQVMLNNNEDEENCLER